MGATWEFEQVTRQQPAARAEREIDPLFFDRNRHAAQHRYREHVAAPFCILIARGPQSPDLTVPGCRFDADRQLESRASLEAGRLIDSSGTVYEGVRHCDRLRLCSYPPLGRRRQDIRGTVALPFRFSASHAHRRRRRENDSGRSLRSRVSGQCTSLERDFQDARQMLSALGKRADRRQQRRSRSSAAAPPRIHRPAPLKHSISTGRPGRNGLARSTRC